jgi:hypothetical protein
MIAFASFRARKSRTIEPSILMKSAPIFEDTQNWKNRFRSRR